MVFVYDLQQTGAAEPSHEQHATLSYVRTAALLRSNCNAAVHHRAATHCVCKCAAEDCTPVLRHQMSRADEDCYGTDVQDWRSSARSA